MLDEVKLRCPYCGERFSAFVDDSAGAQDYIEDCPVCCRPIEIALVVGDDGRLDAVRADSGDN